MWNDDSDYEGTKVRYSLKMPSDCVQRDEGVGIWEGQFRN